MRYLTLLGLLIAMGAQASDRWSAMVQGDLVIVGVTAGIVYGHGSGEATASLAALCNTTSRGYTVAINFDGDGFAPFYTDAAGTAEVHIRLGDERFEREEWHVTTTDDFTAITVPTAARSAAFTRYLLKAPSNLLLLDIWYNGEGYVVVFDLTGKQTKLASALNTCVQ